MKTKLLKKVRKRFGWYIRSKKDTDGSSVFVVADHKEYNLIIIDNEYASQFLTNESPEMGWEEYKFRVLFQIMVSPFVSNPVNKQIYKKGKRFAETKTKKL